MAAQRSIKLPLGEIAAVTSSTVGAEVATVTRELALFLLSAPSYFVCGLPKPCGIAGISLNAIGVGRPRFRGCCYFFSQFDFSILLVITNFAFPAQSPSQQDFVPAKPASTPETMVEFTTVERAANGTLGLIRLRIH